MRKVLLLSSALCLLSTGAAYADDNIPHNPEWYRTHDNSYWINQNRARNESIEHERVREERQERNMGPRERGHMREEAREEHREGHHYAKGHKKHHWKHKDKDHHDRDHDHDHDRDHDHDHH